MLGQRLQAAVSALGRGQFRQHCLQPLRRALKTVLRPRRQSLLPLAGVLLVVGDDLLQPLHVAVGDGGQLLGQLIFPRVAAALGRLAAPTLVQLHKDVNVGDAPVRRGILLRPGGRRLRRGRGGDGRGGALRHRLLPLPLVQRELVDVIQLVHAHQERQPAEILARLVVPHAQLAGQPLLRLRDVHALRQDAHATQPHARGSAADIQHPPLLLMPAYMRIIELLGILLHVVHVQHVEPAGHGSLGMTPPVRKLARLPSHGGQLPLQGVIGFLIFLPHQIARPITVVVHTNAI